MQTILIYLLHFRNSADPGSDLLVRSPVVQLQVTYCPNLLKSIHLGIFIQCRSLLSSPTVHTLRKTLTFIHSPLIQFKIISFAWATHCFALCFLALETKIDCKLNLYIPSNVGEGTQDYGYDKIFCVLKCKMCLTYWVRGVNCLEQSLFFLFKFGCLYLLFLKCYFFFKTEKNQITNVNLLNPFVWTRFEIAIEVSIEKFLDDGLCI